ncbi:MAG: apolipoprotein N-acyltransferase [Candidatus Melainabacteria bacterium RIFOXYA12_FULL_32_12]|nr:MAG: apolipoprotein N-acyltransferase [Candidatus Melainabacteria bacterium RIFOXYA2_FULL_32_9]OGI29802.1 MAG: apolipoprotein N-acyltransferase [Candidatus Melainabacteria bacterium RIFOXYA12_FULL_32_12]
MNNQKVENRPQLIKTTSKYVQKIKNRFPINKKPPTNLELDKYAILISFISGLFLAFSMPGFNFSILAWIGLVPLIILINNSKSLRKSLLYSLTFGLGFNLLSLSWFTGLHPLEWLGFSNNNSFILTRSIWIYLSLYSSYFLAIFGLATYVATHLKINTVGKSLLIALSWSIIINKLMALGEFAFPWSMIEYSQYLNLSLLQFAQYIGGIGIGFFIIFINSLLAFIIYELINKNIELKPALVKITTITASVVIIHIIGFIILSIPVKPDKIITATVIQGNITVEEEKKDALSINTAKAYFLKEIKKAPSGLVVIPETAFFEVLRLNDINFYSELETIAKNQNKTIILGTVDVTFENKKLIPTNSAIVLDKTLQTNENSIYDKQRLVPFGEYTPFSNILPDYLKRFTSTAGKTDFYKGNTIKVINTSFGNVAPNICYEMIFPDLIKSQIKNNANILVGLSNLSWFRNSIIKEQFVAFSTMRAAEARKPLIFSANTGHSVIINPNGKILRKLPKNSYSSAAISIGYNNEKSFFSKTIF